VKRTLGACAFAGAICSVMLTGCGTRNIPAAARPVEPIVGTPPPIVTTAKDGLEVHWWIADDTDGAVGAALAEFTEPPLPQGEALRERWNANGLRMVQAPGEQIGELEARLPPLRARRRLWVGWATAWTEIVRGRRAGGASALIIDGQRTSMPTGALRLIARSWPVPIEPTGERQWGNEPRVRLELACQLAVEHSVGAEDVFSQPRVVPVPDEGPILRQLTLETVLDPRFVYVLTSEAPGVVWAPSAARQASPEPPEAAPGSPAEPAAEGSERLMEPEGRLDLPSEPLGPPVSSPLTVGQAMLSASQAETGWRDLRIIVVLIPRAPERYQLLP
jgi:hypothetical protein